MFRGDDMCFGTGADDSDDGYGVLSDTPSVEDREPAAKFAYRDNKSPFDSRPTRYTAPSTTGKLAHALMPPLGKLLKCLPK